MLTSLQSCEITRYKLIHSYIFIKEQKLLKHLGWKTFLLGRTYVGATSCMSSLNPSFSTKESGWQSLIIMLTTASSTACLVGPASQKEILGWFNFTNNITEPHNSMFCFFLNHTWGTCSRRVCHLFIAMLSFIMPKHWWSALIDVRQLSGAEPTLHLQLNKTLIYLKTNTTSY